MSDVSTPLALQAVSGAVRPEARRSADSSGGWRRTLARACAVLGGTIATSAVAWAIASGSASADEQLDRTPLRVSDAVNEVVEAGRDVVTAAASRTNRGLTEAHQAVEEEVRAAQQPVKVSPVEPQAPQPRQQADDRRQASDRQPDRAPRTRADLNDSAEVATTTQDASEEESDAWSLRTTSGSDGSAGSADDAPGAHDPASAPAPTCPAAAASGCSAGSSLMPAFVGVFPQSAVADGGRGPAVTVAFVGRPVSTGDQPGTSPD